MDIFDLENKYIFFSIVFSLTKLLRSRQRPRGRPKRDHVALKGFSVGEEGDHPCLVALVRGELFQAQGVDQTVLQTVG